MRITSQDIDDIDKSLLGVIAKVGDGALKS
jgi:hypothetical protein